MSAAPPPSTLDANYLVALLKIGLFLGILLEIAKMILSFFVLARTVANFQFSAIFTAKKTDHLCLQFSQQIAAQLFY